MPLSGPLGPEMLRCPKFASQHNVICRRRMGQFWSSFVTRGSSLAELWPKVVDFRPSLDDLAELWQMLVEFRPSWDDSGANVADVRPSSVHPRPNKCLLAFARNGPRGINSGVLNQCCADMWGHWALALGILGSARRVGSKSPDHGRIRPRFGQCRWASADSGRSWPNNGARRANCGPQHQALVGQVAKCHTHCGHLLRGKASTDHAPLGTVLCERTPVGSWHSSLCCVALGKVL